MLYWNGIGWSGISNTNNLIDQKQAYFLYIRGERSKGVTSAVSNSSATTLRTKGFVYMGDQVTTVPANGFTLVPNLYASAIDFLRLTRTGGVPNTFYIWDSKKLNGNSLGIYQTFSSTNNFNCLISGGSYVPGQPNTLIESGQAFFVKGGSSNGSIILHESSKTTGSNGLGLRPANPSALVKLDAKLFNEEGVMRDANTIVFSNSYTNAVDDEDAVKIGNPAENFALENNSKLLAIEGRRLIRDVDTIQFRMWNLSQQQYRIELSAFNINPALSAMLEDNYLKNSTPVDLTGTSEFYFSTDTNAASSDVNRFRIVFKQKKLTAVEEKAGMKIYPNPVEGNTINLQFTNQPKGRYSILLLTASGQQLLSKSIIHAGGNCTYPVGLHSKFAGAAYRLQIIDPHKQKQVLSVIINSK